MSIENAKQEEAKRYFITAVNFQLNMWSDSGETDYLRKAIAEIKAQIEKEEGKEHE